MSQYGSMFDGGAVRTVPFLAGDIEDGVTDCNEEYWQGKAGIGGTTAYYWIQAIAEELAPGVSGTYSDVSARLTAITGDYLPRSGALPMTGDLDMNGQSINSISAINGKYLTLEAPSPVLAIKSTSSGSRSIIEFYNHTPTLKTEVYFDNVDNVFSITNRSTDGVRIDTNLTQRILIAGSGAITFNQAYTFPTADGSVNYVMTTNGSGVITWSASSSGSVTGTGTAGKIPKWSTTTALTDSVLVEDSGNIGIGVTPSTIFHILGSASEVLRLESSSTNSIYSASIDLYKAGVPTQDSTTVGGIAIRSKDQSGNDETYGQIYVTTSNTTHTSEASLMGFQVNVVGAPTTIFEVLTTGTKTTGVHNATTGYQINGGATSNAIMRGNGTNFVSAAAEALTKVDDTNVTLTLGGTPASSLINAASLTLGWAGTLSVTRGGTGASTLTGVLKGNGTSAISAMTGTAGKIVKWSDANTLSDSVVVEDSGKIGINVSPSTTLHVYGASGYTTARVEANVTDQYLAYPTVSIYKSGTPGQDATFQGSVTFDGKDKSGNAENYGTILCGTTNTTHTSEASYLSAYVNIAGTPTEKLLINSAGIKATGIVNATTGYQVNDAATSGNVLRGDGTNFISAILAGSDITGAALTKTDDTNVTLTLGGDHATALLRAASIAAGWTGQLSLARGGSNANLTAVAGGLVYSGASAFAISAAGTSGQILKSAGAAAPTWNTVGALTRTDDTNVTLTLGGSHATALVNAASLTLGWTGTLEVARGGSGTGTAFTTGSVIFAGASGVYSQDNANFFWDDANKRLGIGTTAPAQLLHVYSSTGSFQVTGRGVEWYSTQAAAGNDPVRINSYRSREGGAVVDNDNLYWHLVYGHDGTDYNTVGAAIKFIVDGTVATDKIPTEILFQTAAGATANDLSTKMVINPAGNVGIGTTGPTVVLDVQSANSEGDIRLTSTTGTNGAWANFINTGGNFYVGRDSSTGLRLNSTALPYAGTLMVESAHPLVFGTNNLTRMVIDSAGNVGIGTTTPAYLLDVDGDFRVGIQGTANTLFVDTSEGNVGIGTTVPGEKLDVAGNSKVSGYQQLATGTGTVATSGSLRLPSEGDIQWRNVAGTGNQFLRVGAGHQFSQWLDDELRTDANFNVVNTNAIISATNNTSFTQDVGGKLKLRGNYTETGAVDFAQLLGAKENATYQNQMGYLSFSVNTGSGIAEKVRITSSGNVGIGTSAPGAELQIGSGTHAMKFDYIASDYSVISVNTVDGADNRRLFINGGGGQSWVRGAEIALYGNEYSGNAGTLDLRAGSASGNVIITTNGGYISLSGSTGEKVRMTDDGNVGIGTTAPTNILSLGNGAARKFWIENTATDVVGRALTVAAGGTVAGTSVSNVVGGNLILQSGLGTGTGASTISFQTGTTLTTGTTLQTMSTKMTILGSGNVGIGTTAPARKLEVLDASAPQMRLTYTASSVYTDFLTASTGKLSITPSGAEVDVIGSTIYLTHTVPEIRIRSSSDGSNQSLLSFYENTSAPRTYLYHDNFGTPAFYIWNPDSRPIHLYTNNLVRMSIAGAGGITFNNAYTFPTADGTNGYALVTNGSGAVAWTAIAAGIGGSGTANYIAKFSAGTTIADSAIQESGGSVGINSPPVSSIALAVLKNASTASDTLIGAQIAPASSAGGSNPVISVLATPGTASEVTQVDAYSVVCQPSPTGTFTNWYGIYLQPNVLGTVTNKYAIYAAANSGTASLLGGSTTTLQVAPSVNDTYTSGTSSLRWSNVYSVLGDFTGEVLVTAAGAGIQVRDTGTAESTISFNKSTTTGVGWIQTVNSTNAMTLGSISGILGLYANSTLGIVIDTGGNVGIGTSAIDARLDVRRSNAGECIRMYNTGTDSVAKIVMSNDARTFDFWVDGGDSDKWKLYDQQGAAARITVNTSGDVGIGTVTPDCRLHVAKNYTGGPIIQSESTITSGNGGTLKLMFSGSSPNNTTSYFIGGEDSTQARFAIYSNGAMYNNGTYATLSDARLKTNIIDARSYWDDFKKLQYHTYNMKNGGERCFGLVAQELLDIFPSLVSMDGRTGYLSIKSSIVHEIGMSVLVEAQNKIDDLYPRMETLEGKVKRLESEVEELKLKLAA